MQRIYDLLNRFGITNEIIEFKHFKSGHINTTCYIKTDDGKEYVLQKINQYVFKKPDEVMENIASVTSFISDKLESQGIDPTRKVLHFLPSISGEFYTIDEAGDYWRMYDFVNESITFNTTNSTSVLEETGKAFGEFQCLLADYPSETLYETIPNFHNTRSRFNALKGKVLENPVGRLDDIKPIVAKYLKYELLATHMTNMAEAGKLPLRVTHNDTKCNNVLFDEKTQERLCVIDLDTIMPGLIGHDFGDAIRFCATTTAEDEPDTSKVKIDLNKFRAFATGFLSQVAPAITEEEKNTLALSAVTLTLECGSRFLTDYLDGDNYFKTEYPEHNLVRAKNQLALAEDMLDHLAKMQSIVDEIYNEVMQQSNQG